MSDSSNLRQGSERVQRRCPTGCSGWAPTCGEQLALVSSLRISQGIELEAEECWLGFVQLEALMMRCWQQASRDWAIPVKSSLHLASTVLEVLRFSKGPRSRNVFRSLNIINQASECLALGLTGFWSKGLACFSPASGTQGLS